MSSFQALTLCHAVFVVSLFLIFGLLWKSKEAVSEVAWDAIPHACISLSGHYRARMVRLYAFYVPGVVVYIAVGAGSGIVELEIAKLAPGEGIAILANLFAFIMFLAARSSIPMGIVAFPSLAKTISQNERNERASNGAWRRPCDHNSDELTSAHRAGASRRGLC